MSSLALVPLLVTAVLLLFSQVTGMMQRSTISSHVHTYQVIKTHAPPHLHFANRYHEPLAPLNVSFFGLDFTLHLDIDYDYLQHMAPETLNKIDVTRFLYGHVGEYPSTSIVRLYTYERGIDGHMVVRSETGQTLHYFQFETVVEDDGELSDDVIVFRSEDKMRMHPKQMRTCGQSRPVDEVHADVSAPLNATGLLNATDSYPGGIHPTELHKYGPPDYEGHDSFGVLKMAKSLHLSRPPTYDDPMHAHRMVQQGLRRRALWKRGGTSPEAVTKTGRTNMYKAAAMTILYDETLNAKQKTPTWIALLYSHISSRTADHYFLMVPRYIQPNNFSLTLLNGPHNFINKMHDSYRNGNSTEKPEVGAVQLLCKYDLGNNTVGHGSDHDFGDPSVSFVFYRDYEQILTVALHEFLHGLNATHYGEDPLLMAATHKGSPFAKMKSLATSPAWHDVGTLELDHPEFIGTAQGSSQPNTAKHVLLGNTENPIEAPRNTPNDQAPQKKEHTTPGAVMAGEAQRDHNTPVAPSDKGNQNKDEVKGESIKGEVESLHPVPAGSALPAMGSQSSSTDNSDGGTHSLANTGSQDNNNLSGDIVGDGNHNVDASNQAKGNVPSGSGVGSSNDDKGTSAVDEQSPSSLAHKQPNNWRFLDAGVQSRPHGQLQQGQQQGRQQGRQQRMVEDNSKDGLEDVVSSADGTLPSQLQTETDATTVAQAPNNEQLEGNVVNLQPAGESSTRLPVSRPSQTSPVAANANGKSMSVSGTANRCLSILGRHIRLDVIINMPLKRDSKKTSLSDNKASGAPSEQLTASGDQDVNRAQGTGRALVKSGQGRGTTNSEGIEDGDFVGGTCPPSKMPA
ncbi:hypothetical protein RI367_007986 [Sorochytrium milnesiophthora]